MGSQIIKNATQTCLISDIVPYKPSGSFHSLQSPRHPSRGAIVRRWKYHRIEEAELKVMELTNKQNDTSHLVANVLQI